MKPDTWMPLYVADYLADTMHLEAEGHGSYLLLLMACWKSGGSLPNDDFQWQSIARLSAQRWKVLKGTLRAFFQQEPDGKWTHKRVTKELARAKEISQERSKSGTRGAAIRWQSDGKAIANGMANASQTTCQNDAPSQSQLPSKDSKNLSLVVKGALRARKGVDFGRAENRQAYARQKIAPVIGQEAMFAAEDTNHPDHERCVGLARSAARQEGVMWQPPLRRPA